MAKEKKFLDYEGVKHLWSKVNMQDYPNNETLMAVINAIDETKADRNELIQSDWNQNDETTLDYVKNRPFYDSSIVLLDWDGDQSKIEDIVYDVEQTPIFYRVGDSIPNTADEIQQLYESIGANIETTGFYTHDKFEIMPSGTGFECDAFIFTGKDNGNFSSVIALNVTSDDMTFEGDITFPKSGMWLSAVVDPDEYNVIRCSFKQIKTLDPKYLPEEATAQPDWNQNDETALDYVKNRPFYTGDMVETELFDVCAMADAANISWVQVAEGFYQCSSDFDNNNFIFIETPPEVGSDCIVKCNGLSNNFIVQDGTTVEELEDPNFVIIGGTDGFASGNFTQPLILLYPYHLFDASDTSGKYVLWGALVPGDTAPTELKVIVIQQEIKKIDPKFETDPTVPAWAKAENKPEYTADEVGAMSKTDPVGTGSFSMGRKSGTTIGSYSHAEGSNTTASGVNSHAEGYYTTASSYYSHAEGYYTTVSADSSHSEGSYTTASGNSSHAEGKNTTASGDYSHAEGKDTTASGDYSHAEGGNTKATKSNDSICALGSSSYGYYTHAEGYGTVAYGCCSHAEGNGTKSSGHDSHAEGYRTVASGIYSHAEGYYTTASVYGSHAEGSNTKAAGQYSHAEGNHTIACRKSQHVQGEYNISDLDKSSTSPDNTYGKYAHIVGNGKSDSARSNAHTLDWNGVPWFQGRPQFGGSSQDNGSQTVMANGDSEIVLTSAGGKKFSITVDDSGALTATEVTA